MKSPQLAAMGFPDDDYSHLRVMRSANGPYVGSSHMHRGADGKVLFEEPGTRDSPYFINDDEAQSWLDSLELHAADPGSFEEPDGVRYHP